MIDIMQCLDGPWSLEVDLAKPCVDIVGKAGRPVGLIPTAVSSFVADWLVTTPVLGDLALRIPEEVDENGRIGEDWLDDARRLVARLPHFPRGTDKALRGPWRASRTHSPSVVDADGRVIAFFDAMSFATAASFVPYLEPLLCNPAAWLRSDLVEDDGAPYRRYGRAMVLAF